MNSNSQQAREIHYWLFQANPKIYRIVDALKEKEDNWNWMVKQHKKRIAVGDKIIIWVCGEKAGVYALAEVTSEVKLISDKEDPYYIKKGIDGLSERVNIKLTRTFPENPIYKKEILNNNILPIFKRGFRNTNLSISNSDYETVKGLIDNVSL